MKEHNKFLDESKKINVLEKEEGIKERDEILEAYLKKGTTNSCMFPGLVSEGYQEMCDYRNHSEMSVLLGEIVKLTHEFEGIEGVVDITEKIRRTYTEMLQKMVEKNEKKEKENV